MTAEWNTCVFSFRRNTVNDESDVMSSGRQFHSFGPTEAKWSFANCDKMWQTDSKMVQSWQLKSSPRWQPSLSYTVAFFFLTRTQTMFYNFHRQHSSFHWSVHINVDAGSIYTAHYVDVSNALNAHHQRTVNMSLYRMWIETYVNHTITANNNWSGM